MTDDVENHPRPGSRLVRKLQALFRLKLLLHVSPAFRAHFGKGRKILGLSFSQLDRIRVDPSNQTFALYLELCYMDTYLRQGNEDLAERIHGDGREVCDPLVVEWCERFAKAEGHLPKVLDFGAGVASSLLYLQRRGLAHLTAVDALGGEFQQLHALHGLEIPVPSQRGIGEFLDEQFAPESFDLVHVRNALDHTQSPALVWLNLFHLVRVDGVLCHSHAIREATAEHWHQLHQFDLYPVEDSLWIEDRSRQPFSMTDDLPLETAWHASLEDAPKPWFNAGYIKSSGSIESSAPYRNSLEQLRRAFKRRSQWAFQIESTLMRASAKDDPATHPVPIHVDPDRA